MGNLRGKWSVSLLALLCLAFAPGPVPTPWTDQDIGAPGLAGSATFDPVTTVWSVTGSGGDIWGNADQFNFASMPVTGDFTITAHVATLTSGTLDQWAKAGVMARDTNAAGSMYAFEHWTGNNGTDFQFRNATDGAAAQNGQTGTGVNHQWVRVQRTGNAFQGSWSDDGVTWTAHGGAQTIAMGATILVGLAVTAHNNGVTANATFDNLKIADGTGTVFWPIDPPTNLLGTAGINNVALTWTASPSASVTGYTILRGTANGGPYGTVVGTTAGTNFTDNTAANPGTFYYVVVATNAMGWQSGYSNQAGPFSPLPAPVSVSPTSITTSESGTTANLTLTVNVQPTAAATVQVTSSLPSQALVSGQAQGPASTITINIPSGATVGTTYTVTVTGQRDYIDNGNQLYTIDFVVGGGGAVWTGAAIPSVNGTNLDIDTASLLVNPTAGLTTNTNGLTDTFTVRLNSKPVNPVTINPISSSDGTEATVSPTQVVFDGTNWDQPVTVTVTGQGLNITYLNASFTITLTVQAGSDTAYLGKTATVTGVNIHLEAPPALKTVWGNSGGCGLSGAEVLIPLGLIALLRRRRGRRA